MTLLIGIILSIRKVTSESALLREHLAAEESSKRHFMNLVGKHEGTIALQTQEMHRKELDNTMLRFKVLKENDMVGIL